MNVLYEILIPTRYGDNHAKPISTRHHKQWDKYVQSITGGLTILGVGKGKWLHKGIEYPERIILVRVMCVETLIDCGSEMMGRDVTQINKIIQFTLKHYRQKAVMYYAVTNQVEIAYANPLTK